MKKTLSLALVASLSVLAISCGKENTTPDNGNKQEPEVINPAAFTTLSLTDQNYQMIAGSNNGKFIGGSNYATGLACIWDVEKNTFTDIPGAYGDVYAITNSGLAVGHYKADPNSDQMTDFGFVYDGKALTQLWVNTELVDKNSFDENWNPIVVKAPKEDGSDAWAVSADGTIVAGTAIDGWYAYPCVWKAPFTSKADRIDLPYPTSEEMGFEVSGAQARWISADGSVVAGFLIDDMSTNPLVLWERQSDGSYKCNPICKAYYHPFEWDPSVMVSAPYMQFTACGISPNGKYVALAVQEYTEEFVDSKTARLNLETLELEVLSGSYIEPGSISNDGTIAGSTSMFDFENPLVPFVWAGGESTSVKLSDMFSSPEFDKLLQMKVCGIAADNSSAFGWAYDTDYEVRSFIVK